MSQKRFEQGFAGPRMRFGHTKMEVHQRQAYGFRNFQNYRLRVKV